MEWLTTTADAISQFLTTSPFWLQITLVFVVVVPACSALAMVWLRIVDILGATALRLSTRGRARLHTLKGSDAPQDAPQDTPQEATQED